MTSGASATNSAACLRMRSVSPAAQRVSMRHVAAVGPAQFLQSLHERRDASLCLRVVRGEWNEHADAPHPLGLLRARRERPRRRRAAEQRDELAPLHVWMAPAWQEIIWRAAQRSLAVMCPAC